MKITNLVALYANLHLAKLLFRDCDILSVLLLESYSVIVSGYKASLSSAAAPQKRRSPHRAKAATPHLAWAGDACRIHNLPVEALGVDSPGIG